MAHHDFGQDRLAQPHPLQAFRCLLQATRGQPGARLRPSCAPSQLQLTPHRLEPGPSPTGNERERGHVARTTWTLVFLFACRVRPVRCDRPKE